MVEMFQTVYGVTTTEFTPENNIGLSLTGQITAGVLLFGLIFHISAFLTTRKARKIWKDNSEKNVPYFLLSTLLNVDFAAVVFFLIRGFAFFIQGWSPTLWCNFSVSTSLFFTTASGLTNVAMCFERCLALMAPFAYRKHTTLFKAKVAVFVCIGVSIAFSILPFFGLSSYTYEKDGTIICVSPGYLISEIDYMLVYTILFFIIGFSIVLAVLICNFIVVYFILRLSKAIIPGLAPNIPRLTTKSASDHGGSLSSKGEATTSKDDAESKHEDDVETERAEAAAKAPAVVDQRKHDVQLASLFIGVSVIYTISWLPLYITRLLTALQVETPEILFSLTIGLISMNHVVDPILFVFFKKRNQQALKLLLLKACCSSPSYRKRVEDSIKNEI